MLQWLPLSQHKSWSLYYGLQDAVQSGPVSLPALISCRVCSLTLRTPFHMKVGFSLLSKQAQHINASGPLLSHFLCRNVLCSDTCVVYSVFLKSSLKCLPLSQSHPEHSILNCDLSPRTPKPLYSPLFSHHNTFWLFSILYYIFSLNTISLSTSC